VDEHSAAPPPGRLDKLERLVEILAEILVAVVRGVQLLVQDAGVRRVAGRRRRHVEHVVDAEAAEGGRVPGVLHVAEEEEGRHLGGGMVLDVLGGGRAEVGGGGRGGEEAEGVGEGVVGVLVVGGGGGGVARSHQVILAEAGLGGLKQREIINYLTFSTSFIQCCGSGMFIPDPGYDFFPSRI
jgi:hypothetical protein